MGGPGAAGAAGGAAKAGGPPPSQPVRQGTNFLVRRDPPGADPLGATVTVTRGNYEVTVHGSFTNLPSSSGQTLQRSTGETLTHDDNPNIPEGGYYFVTTEEPISVQLTQTARTATINWLTGGASTDRVAAAVRDQTIPLAAVIEIAQGTPQVGDHPIPPSTMQRAQDVLKKLNITSAQFSQETTSAHERATEQLTTSFRANTW